MLSRRFIQFVAAPLLVVVVGCTRLPAGDVVETRGTTGETARPEVRDLTIDEARGGHTLSRHVGLSDADLRERLRREPGIAAASTYLDRETAERTVAHALVAEAARVARWSHRSGRRPNLALDHRGASDRPIGRSLRRGDRRVSPCYDATVVLKWDDRRRDFFVLTSYPEGQR